MILALSLCITSTMAETMNSESFDAAAFFERLIAGEGFVDLVSMDEILASIKGQVFQSLKVLLLNLALPTLACALLQMTTGEGHTGLMLNLLCAVCCGRVLMRAWLSAQEEVVALMDGVLAATERMTPILVSAAALTGGSVLSSTIGPLSALCAAVITKALKAWGLSLCRGAVVTALSSAVAGRYALNRLFDLIKSAAHWLLCVSVFIYGALVSAQGLVSAARDGAAVKTAQVAMERLIPIIGGGVSDAAGSLAVSASLARSAVGLTGVALIASVCLKPALKLGGLTAALKLVAAVTEPFAGDSISGLTARFGDVLEILLATSVCAALMAAMIPAGFAVLSGVFS